MVGIMYNVDGLIRVYNIYLFFKVKLSKNRNIKKLVDNLKRDLVNYDHVILYSKERNELIIDIFDTKFIESPTESTLKLVKEVFTTIKRGFKIVICYDKDIEVSVNKELIEEYLKELNIVNFEVNYLENVLDESFEVVHHTF